MMNIEHEKLMTIDEVSEYLQKIRKKFKDAH